MAKTRREQTAELLKEIEQRAKARKLKHKAALVAAKKERYGT